MVEIEWREPIVPELRAALEPHVAAYSFLFPRWLKYLTIRTLGVDRENPENDVAMVEMEVPYGLAAVNVVAGYLAAGEDERERLLAHEFAHLPLAPYHDFTEHLLKEMEEAEGKSPALAALRRICTDRMEETVVDLAESAVAAVRAGRGG